MQGKKLFLDKEVVRFRLSERVPPHNLYRWLAELVDWPLLYDATRGLYSHTGQPSLEPVVFFKLVLVGRLENLVSDRRLVEHCALRLDILLFLGYEVDEELPWHSTVSRTRQLFPAAVFERLFDHVFAQCVNQGLVAGDTQAVDSAPVKANASLEAVREKQAAGTCGPLLAPDARIYIKSGKARALNYLCRLAVDTAKGVISPVQADYADQRDSRHLPRLLTGLQQRLRTNDRRGHELLADAGYTNGSNYAWLEAAYITPWIPVFGQYKAEIECFTSHLQQDVYHCRAGKALSFRKYDTTADGTWLKSY